jgi:hypothetical protein
MSAYAHQMEQQYSAVNLSDDSGMTCFAIFVSLWL